MKYISVYPPKEMSGREAQIGDNVSVSEIAPRAGISSGHYGTIVEVHTTDDGEERAYFMKMEDGKYRLVTNQEKWGYAYNYFDEYAPSEKPQFKWKKL